MYRDEVTTPWCKPDCARATRRAAATSRREETSRTPAAAALGFSLDEWQAFVAQVQATAPYSLGAWAEALAEVVCYASTE